MHTLNNQNDKLGSGDRGNNASALNNIQNDLIQ